MQGRSTGVRETFDNVPVTSWKREMDASIVPTSIVSQSKLMTVQYMIVCAWKQHNNKSTGRHWITLSLWLFYKNLTMWVINGVMRSSHSTSINRAATPNFQTPVLPKFVWLSRTLNFQIQGAFLMTKRVVKLKRIWLPSYNGSHQKIQHQRCSCVFSSFSGTPTPSLWSYTTYYLTADDPN